MLPHYYLIQNLPSSLLEASGSKSASDFCHVSRTCLASLRLVDLNQAAQPVIRIHIGLASLRLVDLNDFALGYLLDFFSLASLRLVDLNLYPSRVSSVTFCLASLRLVDLN